jgi:hypothetical protein
MQRIYLDQNKWLDLSRAAWGRKGGERYADALAVARFGVEHSLASFPLSSSHYVETLRRKDAASRRRLAGLMVTLSRFHAIAPPSRIIEGELDAALYSRFGKPGDPRPLQPFGMGVWFAMGTEEHRYQVPADADLPPGRRYEFELWANEFLQAAMIMGPNEGQAVPGMVENNFYLDIPRKYAQGETRLSEASGQLRRLPSGTIGSLLQSWLTSWNLLTGPLSERRSQQENPKTYRQRKGSLTFSTTFQASCGGRTSQAATRELSDAMGSE